MRFGLVGETLAHSYSKDVHAMLGSYDYSLFEVSKDGFESFIRARKYEGLNITIPYKRNVINLIDELDPGAAAIGAVNTLYFRASSDGSGRRVLAGANTDITGFKYAADAAGIPFKDKNVLIAGTGGASLTVRRASVEMGAENVMSVSRTGQGGALTYYDLAKDSALRGSFDIIVNATPVGMYPSCRAKVLDLEGFPRCSGVIDLVYDPYRSALLLQAEKIGIRNANGLAMLVAQAAAAAELWTGRELMSRIPAIIDQIKAAKLNIILVGMPGCGKSTVGRALAEMTGRKFVDSDDEINKRTARTPDRIITEEGEGPFRKLETEILRDLCRESGLVIATGGGAVTVPDNIDLMRQNGTVIFLERVTEDLSVDGRPLSERISPERLLRMRLPMYMRAADITAKNSGSPEEAAGKIISLLSAYYMSE